VTRDHVAHRARSGSTLSGFFFRFQSLFLAVFNLFLTSLLV